MGEVHFVIDSCFLDSQILWTFPTIKVVSKCENFDKCANSFKAHNFILWKKKGHLFLKREKTSPQK